MPTHKSQAHLFDRSRQREKKRAALILEAARAFHENGYAGTTLDMLAKRLGITKKALYNYVSGKSELLLEIFLLWLDLQEKSIGEAEQAFGDAEAKLRVYASNYVQSVYEHFVPMERMVGELDTLEEDAVRSIQLRRRKNDQRLAALFESGQAGEFADWDAKYAVHVLNGAIDWMFKWLKPGGKVTPEEASRGVIDIVMYGFRKR
ncbi:TetR family transcriptional regulator [Pacificimonas sp. WHA3]|uniref:TetR family transcriptional regulator n=1 Tax=Pacificimonas pallii TaxID=2827236 RepID=A0ABS6SAC1_9SPHN|nr:TetR/AcrR family transcriptional regulator [Pacificimonas pallii]MBV7255328.1 TetR family transcriptional regulator [Pacificimonas pallii]